MTRDAIPYSESTETPLAEALGNRLCERQLQDVAALFRILSDPTRVLILRALQGRELCVCDLRDMTNLTQSAISHQLRLLRHTRLVRSRREGKKILNALDDEHVSALLAQALSHVTEDYTQ